MGNERSKADALILKHARKSPDEIAALIGGVTPEWAAERRSELLSAKDTLTVAQQEVLLLEELGSLKDTMLSVVEHAKDQVLKEGGDVNAFAAVARAASTAMKDIGARLDQRKKVVDADLERIHAAHARVMISAIREALGETESVMVEAYPDMDGGALREAFARALPAAMKRIDKEVAE